MWAVRAAPLLGVAEKLTVPETACGVSGENVSQSAVLSLVAIQVPDRPSPVSMTLKSPEPPIAVKLQLVGVSVTGGTSGGWAFATATATLVKSRHSAERPPSWSSETTMRGGTLTFRNSLG